MSNESNTPDPMEFLKSIWGSMGFSLPGMVTPTLDVDEVGKRIADLKAVEGWLKMNLSTLQMTIQGLEMQRVALTTAQAMGQAMSQAAQAVHANQGAHTTEQHPGTDEAVQMTTVAAESAAQFQQSLMDAALNPALSSLWPWNFMQTATTQAQDTNAAETSTTSKPSESSATSGSSGSSGSSDKPKRPRKKQGQ